MVLNELASSLSSPLDVTYLEVAGTNGVAGSEGFQRTAEHVANKSSAEKCDPENADERVDGKLAGAFATSRSLRAREILGVENAQRFHFRGMCVTFGAAAGERIFDWIDDTESAFFVGQPISAEHVHLGHADRGLAYWLSVLRFHGLVDELISEGSEELIMRMRTISGSLAMSVML